MFFNKVTYIGWYSAMDCFVGVEQNLVTQPKNYWKPVELDQHRGDMLKLLEANGA